MDLISKQNYIGTKFLVQDVPALKSNLFSKKGIFKSYVSSFYAKDSIIKTYFDTDDSFFFSKGISINTTRTNNKDVVIVVRYSSSTPRIAFLNNIPDTFTKTIDRKDSIEKHFDFITAAAEELRPTGLGVNTKEVTPNIKPQVTVIKKRERYRLLNNEGLKLILSLDEAEYSTFYNSSKQKLNMCETVLLSDRSTSRLFYNFEHDLAMQIPSIIKLAENDLAIAQTYLGTKK